MTKITTKMIWKAAVLLQFIFLSAIPAFAQPDCENVTIGLHTGLYAQEINFSVSDEFGNLLFDLQETLALTNVFLQNNTTYTFEVCIPNGCYSVYAYDSWGDGWNGGYVNIGYSGIMETIAFLEQGSFQIFPFGINTDDCAPASIPGCTDPNAINFNPLANVNDDSCEYNTLIEGCTDPIALNYNPQATIDDDSCQYEDPCDGAEATLYICTFSNGDQIELEILDSQGNQVEYITGLGNAAIVYYDICLDAEECYTVNMSNSTSTGWYGGYFWINSGDTQVSTGALAEDLEFDSTTFSISNTGCPYAGCTDPEAFNYDQGASFDDNSCIYIDECEATTLFLTYSPGSWPEEVSWTITDDGGNLVANSIEYPVGAAYTDVLCLGAGCYTVNMGDSFGDGWNGGILQLIGANNEIFGEYTIDYGNAGVGSFGINTDGCVVTIEGCTDPTALNYNPLATVEDDSCEYPAPIPGCMDPNAQNYNWQATEDDGSCIYPEPCDFTAATLYICTFSNGNQVNLNIVDSQGNEVIAVANLNNAAIVYYDICLDPNECYTITMSNNTGPYGWYGGYFWITGDNGQLIQSQLNSGQQSAQVFLSIDGSCNGLGCTDPEALNYDEAATIDDGSCIYPIYGCTNPNALNYNPSATEDDGSCQFPEPCESNESLIIASAGNWGYEMSWSLFNENGVVAYGGNYQNYEVVTTSACLEDGCYTLEMFDSFGDGWNGGSIIIMFGDQTVNASLPMGEYGLYYFSINTDGCPEEQVIFGCTDPQAMNYNPEATEDDDSCEYYECWGTEVIFTIETGAIQDYVSWGIGNQFGAYYATGSTITPYNTSSFAVCLEDACHTIFFYDQLNGWDQCVITATLNGEILFTSTGSNYQGLQFGVNVDCEDTPIWGCTDPNALNYNPEATEDDGSCQFEEPCESNEAIIVSQSGTWGNEMSWALFNANDTVAYGGGYSDNNAITTLACLEDGCYTLEMYDSFGDGWNGGYWTIIVGEDYYTATLDTGEYGILQFGVNTEGCVDEETVYGCTDPEAANYNPEANIDDSTCEYECWGSEVIVTISTGNIQEYIYWGIGNQFGAYYAAGSIQTPNTTVSFPVCLEDACHTIFIYDELGGWDQSFITATLNGETLFISTGTNYEGLQFGVNTDCGNTPVYGCTDPEAANYNPEATDDDGTCFYNPDCNENSIVIYIETQSFGNEISWSMTNEFGEDVGSGDGYSSYSSSSTTLCLADGCYSLSLNDSWGDGWNGAYYMILGNGQLYAEGTLLYGDHTIDLISINGECAVAGCTDPTAINFNPNATFDDNSCIFNNGISMNPGGLAMPTPDLDINFFPNPFESNIQWVVNNADGNNPINIEVFDAVGRIVVTKNYNSNANYNTNIIEFDQLESGVYFFTLRNGERAKTTRLIKK